MIPLNSPQIGDEEIAAVIEVLKSGILTSGLGNGPNVVKFEKFFAEYIKSRYAIAVNSGTAALHAALLAAGVSKGDEIILPSFTFVATAETVVLTGAKPVFVDITPETYTVDPDEIDKAITEKTKAVIPVDLFGLSADMKPIKEVAEKHGLTVIEDAAQAHGALYLGKPPGKFADMACWSFYATKNMTTGEGGMVTTDDDDFAEKLLRIRSHGEDGKYYSITLGHNYRMPEIAAAIGCVQLKKLPLFLEKRRRNAEKLTEKLEGCEKLVLPVEPKGYRHGWHLYTVRFIGANAKERDRLVEKLRNQDIAAGVYYRFPIHQMSFYRRFGVYKLPETEKASKQVLSLPVHPGVSEEQASFIAETVIQMLKQV